MLSALSIEVNHDVKAVNIISKLLLDANKIYIAGYTL